MNSDYSEILTKLRDLSPRDFEEFVADVWHERQGWSTEVSPPGPDRGLDVMGQPPDGGPKTALQCKRFQEGGKVSSRRVQEYSSLRNIWDEVEGVTIVTTGKFTSNAQELAEELDIKLIDGEKLAQLIQRYDAEEILEWYVQGKPEGLVKMKDDDDDLRFGDVKSSTKTGGSGLDMLLGAFSVDLLLQAVKALIILYVILYVLEVLFNIPIPFV